MEASAGKGRSRGLGTGGVVLTAVVGVLFCMPGNSWGAAHEEVAFEEVESIPSRLMSEVDETGETWSLNRDGYVEHSGESLFNQAQRLTVKGAEFSTATLGKVKDENHW